MSIRTTICLAVLALAVTFPVKAEDYEQRIRHEREAWVRECVEHKEHRIREMQERREISYREAEHMRERAREECWHEVEHRQERR